MPALFLFGTLLDDDLRAIVAGHPLAGRSARLPGQAIRRARDGDYPVLVDGDGADGLLIADLPDAALERLTFYENGFGYVPETVSVMAGGEARPALVYRPGTSVPPGDEAWSLAEWQRDWGNLTRAAAREAMSLFGRIDGAALRRAMPTIRVRNASAQRAASQPAPTVLRRPHTRDDVDVIAARRPYSKFFALDEVDLTHATFAGGRSETLTRAGLVSGDAAIVLPYDPVRDRVLLVEQFRFGPWMRGDANPWCLEPVAGFIDPGETPERAARREAEEEAGLTLHDLRAVASCYPSPGGLSEYQYCFVGLCDLPDPTPGFGGLDEEGEDIRTHVIPFADLMDLVESGEADVGPLLLLTFWLARQRDKGTLRDPGPA